MHSPACPTLTFLSRFSFLGASVSFIPPRLGRNKGGEGFGLGPSQLGPRTKIGATVVAPKLKQRVFWLEGFELDDFALGSTGESEVEEPVHAGSTDGYCVKLCRDAARGDEVVSITSVERDVA